MLLRTLFFSLLIIGISGFSQGFENFQSLQSSGELPAAYFEAATEKVKAAKSTRESIILNKEFFASSEIFVDDLLRSGKLLVNGPLSEYVEAVAWHVLGNDSVLLKELSFFVLKSNDVNAFSTDPGVIVVTTGLLAQLNNEAELAFVLAHEITHYVKKHVRNNYLEYRKILREDPYNYKSRNLQKMITYSQKLEFEADLMGMKYLLATDYDLNAVETALQTLVYSYLPFEDFQFNLDYLNVADVKLSASLIPDTINEIDQDIFYDDSHMSHPNIGSRIDKGVLYAAQNQKEGKKKLFIVGEDAFRYAKTASRFESLNLSLEDASYVEVIYSAYILSKNFKDNLFIELAVGKALYGLAKYKLYDRYDEVTYDLATIEGESFPLHSLFENISKEELYVYTVAYFEQLADRFPKKRIIKKYLDNIKLDVSLYKEIDLDQFVQHYTKPMYIDSIRQEVNTIDGLIDSLKNEKLTKLAKIRKSIKLEDKKRELNNIIENGHSYYGWLSNCLSTNRNYINDWQAMPLLSVIDTTGYKFDTVQTSMGIDSIMILDPIYLKFDLNQSVKNYKSKAVEAMVDELLAADYPNLPLERYSLSSHSFPSYDNAASYNQMSLLKSYFNEILEHDNMNMIASMHDQVQLLTDSVKIEKVLQTYIFSSKIQVFKKKVYPVLFYTIVGIPIILADFVQSNHIYCTAIILDTKTDKISAVNYEVINLSEQKWQMKPFIYSVLKNINDQPVDE